MEHRVLGSVEPCLDRWRLGKSELILGNVLKTKDSGLDGGHVRDEAGDSTPRWPANRDTVSVRIPLEVVHIELWIVRVSRPPRPVVPKLKQCPILSFPSSRDHGRRRGLAWRPSAMGLVRLVSQVERKRPRENQQDEKRSLFCHVCGNPAGRLFAPSLRYRKAGLTVRLELPQSFGAAPANVIRSFSSRLAISLWLVLVVEATSDVKCHARNPIEIAGLEK